MIREDYVNGKEMSWAEADASAAPPVVTLPSLALPILVWKLAREGTE